MHHQSDAFALLVAAAFNHDPAHRLLRWMERFDFSLPPEWVRDLIARAAALRSALMPKRTIVYLATPYSHPDAAVREARYVAVTRHAARMVAEGVVVFSPITMSHPIEVLSGAEPAPTDVWIDFDEPFMDASAECVVLTLPGWTESRGVAREIAYFTAQGKPVRFVEPEPA